MNEKVAVIAYYLAHLAPTSERRDHIAAGDLKPYFVQAGLPLPSAPPNMTLLHAKNAGYFNALARGQYSLNAVGHNLVAHKLPSRGRDEVHKPAKKTRKPTKKKARSKAKK